MTAIQTLNNANDFEACVNSGDLFNRVFDSTQDRAMAGTIVESAKQIIASKKHLKVAPQSLFKTLVDLGTLGLVPNDHLGHAYIAIFEVYDRNHKKKMPTMQVIIGYKGLVSLIMRSGHYSGVNVRVVWPNDEFKIQYGTDPHIHHIPSMEFNERQKPIGYYAIAQPVHGKPEFVFMSEKEMDSYVAKERNAAKAGNSAWDTHNIEMRKKSCLRRLDKYLSHSHLAKKAIAIEDETMGYDEPKIVHSDDIKFDKATSFDPDIIEPEPVVEYTESEIEKMREEIRKRMVAEREGK